MRHAHAVGGAEAGDQRRIRPIGRRREYPLEEQREHADDGFDQCVGKERICNALGESSREPCADCHAADKYDQNDRLRVRSVTDEELEVIRPDRFVDQAAEARHGEEREQDPLQRRGCFMAGIHRGSVVDPFGTRKVIGASGSIDARVVTIASDGDQSRPTHLQHGRLYSPVRLIVRVRWSILSASSLRHHCGSRLTFGHSMLDLYERRALRRPIDRDTRGAQVNLHRSVATRMWTARGACGATSGFVRRVGPRRVSCGVRGRVGFRGACGATWGYVGWYAAAWMAWMLGRQHGRRQRGQLWTGCAGDR